MPPATSEQRRAPLVRAEPGRGDSEQPDRDEQQQDRELDGDHVALGPRHGRGPGDVEHRDEDDGGGEEGVLADLVVRVRQEARRVAAERLGVQREHHDVAHPQQHVDAAGEQPGPERAVDEGHRPPAARVRRRQQRVGPCGEQRDQSRDEERDRRSTAGDLHRQPEDREDPAADHPTDADRHDAPQPDASRRPRLAFRHRHPASLAVPSRAARRATHHTMPPPPADRPEGPRFRSWVEVSPRGASRPAASPVSDEEDSIQSAIAAYPAYMESRSEEYLDSSTLRLSFWLGVSSSASTVRSWSSIRKSLMVSQRFSWRLSSRMQLPT